jgi:ribosomal protein S18 acetylase RimI-like enzyme
VKDIVTFLEKMNAISFEKYIEEFIPSYARDNVLSGLCSEESSIALARNTIEKLLPDGLLTSDNFLYDVHAQVEQPSIGMLWFLVQEKDGKKLAFLCDVRIKPEHQRLGHATRALALVEEKVRAMGLSGIALHVFGHNVGAHSLYQKLGFRPTNITMLKQVEYKNA